MHQHEHHDHFAEKLRHDTDRAPGPDGKGCRRQHHRGKRENGDELERHLGDRNAPVETAYCQRHDAERAEHFGQVERVEEWN